MTRRIIAINGSPRKDFNTAEMCDSFLKGAKSANPEIETKIANIYDYDFKGCKACMGCKLANGGSYGKCVQKDGITKLLEEVSNADGVVFASPIYFADITGELKCFLERLLFPYFTYEEGFKTIAPKRFQTAMIYTMNVGEEDCKALNYDATLSRLEGFIGHTFTKPERIFAFCTYQVKDYSLYKMGAFSESAKLNYKKEHWQNDLQKAFDAGKRMAASI